MLAGSALTMRDAVANLHGHGIALEAALTAATAVPARIAGAPRLGRLAVGEPADVLVLDDRLEVTRVLLSPATSTAALRGPGSAPASRVEPAIPANVREPRP